MAKFSATSNIYNDYAKAREILRSQASSFYDEGQWQNELSHGRIDMYINAINKSGDIDKNKLVDDYKLDFADKDSVTKAIYNEIYTDKVNKRNRKIVNFDNNGNVVTDDSGKPTYHDVEMTDYDYYKQQMAAYNYAKSQEEMAKLKEQSDKKSFNFWKALATIVTPITSASEGAMNQVNELGAQMQGITAWLSNYIRTGSKTIADDARLNAIIGGRSEVLDELENALKTFESKYTYLRDEDGNYTEGGKLVGQLFYTLGQMLPGMGVGRVLGAVSTAAGLSSATAGTIAGASSQLVFYAALDAGQVRETYDKFVENNCSISSSQLLANADIKASLQWLVEVGLARALGASKLDEVVFGRTPKVSTSQFGASALRTSGSNRLLHDFIEEGLEEVFQDTSDYLVDRIYMHTIDQNYGQLTDLTPEGIATSFVMGGLASLVGASLSMLSTKKVSLNTFETDKDGNIVVDKDGNPVFKKLSKLQSWEYGLSMDSVIKNFSTLIEIGKNNDFSIEDARRYNAAFLQAYAAVRMMESVYAEVGETRFNAVNAILTDIEKSIANNDYASETIARSGELLITALQADNTVFDAKAKNKLEEAHIVIRDNIKMAKDSDVAFEADQLKKATGAKNVVLVDKIDKSTVINDNNGNTAIVTSQPILKNQSTDTVLYDLAEQSVVEKISTDIKDYGLNSNDIGLLKDIYKLYTRTHEEPDIKTIVTALLFEKNFLSTVLFQGNINIKIISFIAKLDPAIKGYFKSDTLADIVKTKRLSDALNNIKNQLTKFFEVMPNLPFESYGISFSKSQIDKIKSARYYNSVYLVVMTRKIADNDKKRIIDLIEKRLKIASDIDGQITLMTKKYSINDALDLFKKYLDTGRYKPFVEAIMRSTNMITNYYDGIHYPLVQSVTNRSFIAYLETLDMDMQEFFARPLTEEEIKYFSFKRSVDANNIIADNKRDIALVRSFIFKDSIENNRFGNEYDYELNYEIENDEVNLESVFVRSNYASLSRPSEYKFLRQTPLDKAGNVELSVKSSLTKKKTGNKGKISIADAFVNKDVNSGIRESLTIDDLIINPSLIDKNITKNIDGWIFASNAASRAALLNRYIIDNYSDTVISQDIYGRYVLTDTSSFNRIIVDNYDAKIEAVKAAIMLGQSYNDLTLKDIIKKEYIPVGYENVKVLFVDMPGYAGMTHKNSDGSIEIRVDINSEINDITDTIRHEFDHMCQIAALLSGGAGDIVSNLRNQDEFIKDIKKHAPHLLPINPFLDRPEYIKQLDDAIYSCITGEIYANGFSGSEVYSYGTISAVNVDGFFSLSTPWGKVYKTTMRTADAYKLEDNANNEAIRFFNTEQLSVYNDNHDVNLTHNTLTSSRYVKISEKYVGRSPVYRVVTSDGFNLKLQNVDDKTEMNATEQMVVPTTRRGVIFDNITKEDFVKRFGKEDREKWLRRLYENLGGDKQFGYSEFLNTEIPIIFVSNEKFDVSRYQGAFIGLLNGKYVSNITFIKVFENYKGRLTIGKIKPTDIKYYSVDSCYNCYVDPTTINSIKTYGIDRTNGKLFVNTEYNTINNDSYITEKLPDNTERETEAYDKEYDRYKYLETDRENIYTKQKIRGRGKITNIEYEYGGKSDNYDRRTRITFADNSSMLTDYRRHKGFYKNTKISDSKASDTNLKYFVGKSLSPQLQSFIINADGDNKVATELQEKIDGAKKGTLNYRDVYNYLRDTSESKFDDKTFDAINNAFYQNENIKDIHDLDTKVGTTVQAYTLGELLKLKELEQYLDNKYDDVIKRINEFVSKNKDYEARLRVNQARFDKEHIDDRRLRDLWMRYYDGTARSAWNLARMSYIAARRQWNRSDYDVSGRMSTYSGDVEVVEGGGTVLENMADDAKDFVSAIIEAESADKVKFVATMKVIEALLRLEKAGKNFEGDILDTIDKAYEIISNMEDEEIDQLYNKYYRYKDSPKVKSMLMKYEAAVINDDSQISTSTNETLENTSRSSHSIMQNIKAFGRKITAAFKDGRLSKEDVDGILNNDGDLDHSLYQNKSASGQITYKDRETMLAVEDKLRQIVYGLRNKNNENKINEQYKKEMRAIGENVSPRKIEITKNQFVDRIGEVTIIFEGPETEMPDTLRRFTGKQFKDYDISQARFAIDGDPKHMVLSANEFFDEYSSFLNNLDQSDAIDIAEFFASVKATVIGDLSTMFNATQIFLSMYILDGASGKNPRFNLGEDLKKRLRLNMESIAGRAGQELQAFNQAYLRLKPQERVVRSLAKKYGFEVDEARVAELNEAVKSGDLKAIQDKKKALLNEMMLSSQGVPSRVISAINTISKAIKTGDRDLLNKARQQIFDALKDNYKDEKTLKENIKGYVLAVASNKGIDGAKRKLLKGMLTYRKNKNILNRIYEFERAAMLSGPGTWVRNQASNIVLRGTNWVAEKIGNAATELLYKVFPKHRVKVQDKIDERYRNFANVKVDDNISKWIKTNIIDTKYYELIKDGITKYTSKQKFSKSTTGVEALTKLIVDSVVSEVFADTATDIEALKKMYGFVNKMISDDMFIKKSFIKYLSKIITVEKIDTSRGMAYKPLINAMARAYSFAAADYMHKGNFVNNIESWISNKFGEKGYFVYKQVFPFLSASVNWFLEGIRLSPVGLLHSIYKFARLENTIEKAELEYREGKSAVDPRFTEYLIKRNIGKGIIGTIGWAIGAILAGCGVAGIDEKDDKLKLHVKDVYIDITSLFGTQGILQGIAFVNAIQSSGNKNGGEIFVGIIKTVFDQMFEDSTVSEMYNTFRYNDGFADALIGKLLTVPSMFIPNMLKFVSFSNAYKVNYEKGITGRLEKLLVQCIPSLSYALPHYIDPYTGEEQIAYKCWALTQFANKLLPINIQPYNVTDIEKLAVSLGINRGQLTGNYSVGDDNIHFNKKKVKELNTVYGELNKKDLEDFVSGKTKFTVLDKKTNKYVTISYSKMTDYQKGNVIERIMNNNASLSRIYMLTTYKGYRYYASSDEEFKQLRSMGAKNVYKGSEKKKGLVKA